MSASSARQSSVDRFEIELELCMSKSIESDCCFRLEKPNRNLFGKMENSIPNIPVHPVRITFDFPFNSIVVDITFVPVVCRTCSGKDWDDFPNVWFFSSFQCGITLSYLSTTDLQRSSDQRQRTAKRNSKSRSLLYESEQRLWLEWCSTRAINACRNMWIRTDRMS